MALAEAEYAGGVIKDFLAKRALKPQTALQNPSDYLDALGKVVRAVLKKAKVSRGAVAALGTDFTASSVLPVFKDGRPLCSHPRLAKNPDAWVKLWKHHATQPQADQINALAQKRREKFITAYGGKYSCEWFFSKVLETVQRSPQIYKKAARFIEASDWIVWQLTGQETRNLSAAGFKGMRVSPSKRGWEYPPAEFFEELDPGLRNVLGEKIGGRSLAPGERAGVLTPAMAKFLGLNPGIPVAAGNIDAHAAVPACGVTKPGTLVMIMGTSTCHLLIGDSRQEVEGICGVVEDGIIPGYWGYEAGQSGVGDLFAWYVNQCAPEQIQLQGAKGRTTVHEVLSREAARLRPGESGLLALDWWNGNRSVLVDADLSGLMVGLTLQTRPREIYRALLEATGFGTRQIVEAFTAKGLPVREIYACGGLATKNPLLMQIYADILQRPIKIGGAEQASAFGAAMFASVAANLHGHIHAAARRMAPKAIKTYRPNPRNKRPYEVLFAQYNRLHDWFGRDAESVMKKLLDFRQAVLWK
jgi:L-ribulokinase